MDPRIKTSWPQVAAFLPRRAGAQSPSPKGTASTARLASEQHSNVGVTDIIAMLIALLVQALDAVKRIRIL